MRRIPGTGCAGAAAAPSQINRFALSIVNNVALNGNIGTSWSIIATAFVRAVCCRDKKNTRAVKSGRCMRRIAVLDYPIITTDRDKFRAGITDDGESVDGYVAVLGMRRVLAVEISNHAHIRT